MIGIQNTIKDDIGTVWLRNYQDSGPYASKARISRQATLDGGAAFSHLGVSACDRDFSVDCRLTDAEAVKIKSFYEGGAELMISFWEGAFIGYIAGLDIERDGAAKILFYFKERLS